MYVHDEMIVFGALKISSYCQLTVGFDDCIAKNLCINLGVAIGMDERGGSGLWQENPFYFVRFVQEVLFFLA